MVHDRPPAPCASRLVAPYGFEGPFTILVDSPAYAAQQGDLAARPGRGHVRVGAASDRTALASTGRSAMNGADALPTPRRTRTSSATRSQLGQPRRDSRRGKSAVAARRKRIIELDVEQIEACDFAGTFDIRLGSRTARRRRVSSRAAATSRRHDGSVVVDRPLRVPPRENPKVGIR